MQYLVWLHTNRLRLSNQLVEVQDLKESVHLIERIYSRFNKENPKDVIMSAGGLENTPKLLQGTNVFWALGFTSEEGGH